MKKIVFGILSGFLFLFSGCVNDDEGYSLNDFWVGFGIVQDSDSHRVIMDNGDVLLQVANSSPFVWYDKDYTGEYKEIETGDRVLINFTIVGDDANETGELEAYFVRVNSVKKILMKGILDITPENQDSIGNDPIIVQECWVTDSLLNFQLKYWGRNEVHFINMVKQPGELTAEGQPFQLELRHNANDDLEDIPYTAYVSFKLDSLQVEGLNSVTFRVAGTDYDGKIFEYDGVYKYGENN